MLRNQGPKFGLAPRAGVSAASYSNALIWQPHPSGLSGPKKLSPRLANRSGVAEAVKVDLFSWKERANER
jgi:hypothetical protein